MKSKFIPLLAAAFFLSGCASDGTLKIPLPTPVQVDTAIQDVQTIANRICGFLPAAETVIGIVGTFTGTSPIVATASAIAEMICNAVKRPGARRGVARGTVKVRGVAVRGEFTR